MKTLKKVPIEPIFLEGFMPETLEQGKLYISEQYECVIHLCLCGCGTKTVTPPSQGWNIIKEKDGSVSITPSILNNQSCGSHYIITKNVANFV